MSDKKKIKIQVEPDETAEGEDIEKLIPTINSQMSTSMRQREKTVTGRPIL
jgi:hypothetical protein